jgi:hypothetical protein
MASRALGERDMKLKNIAALATLGAMILTAAPAMAVVAPPVTVKWNTQKSAAITIYTDPTASQTGNAAPAANDQFQTGSPSLGAAAQCNSGAPGVAGNAGKDGATNGPWALATVNFGNVTPDGANYTNCLEINAVETYVTTNDSAGVNIQAALTAGTPVGYGLAANGSAICIIPANTWNVGSASTFGLSARVAAVAMGSTTACSVGTLIPAGAAPGVSLLNSTVAATQDLNSDFQLNLGPNSTVGSVTATLLYTVTPN